SGKEVSIQENPFCNWDSKGSWHSWYPVKHTEIKVVSIENSEVLADGSKGVVKVRGPQVMKGYYKDHFFQFTDAKF
ncbi:Os09g0512200, partial [Oryza sativa Japonica Group]